MATLLANREVTAKVDGNQDRVATSFVKDKKRKITDRGMEKREYMGSPRSGEGQGDNGRIILFSTLSILDARFRRASFWLPLRP